LLNIFQFFSFKIYQITGVSLYPKFKDKEYVICTTITTFIKKGSFVVFAIKGYKLPMIKQISQTKVTHNGRVQYYVIGLDKINSIDSREFGWVDDSDIIAQVLCKVPHKLQIAISKWFK